MFINRVSLGVLSCVIVPALLLSTRAAAADRAASIYPDSLFQERVAAYVALHRQCEQRLLLKGVDPRAGGGATFRQALAESIRLARRQAQPGDIFCPAVAPRIVQLVRFDLAAREPRDRQAILDSVPCAMPFLRVNTQYPIGEPLATMPPVMLLRLPLLLPEVQYRFVGRTLILLDVEPRLVVDLLPGALPRLP